MNVGICEAIEDLDIAIRQVEFAIRLLSFCELGHIDPRKFDTNHITLLEEGSLFFPSGKFLTVDEITKAAKIGVLQSVAALTLVLDQLFESAGRELSPESDENIDCLRTLIYMMRCAHAHKTASPKWKAKERYCRNLTVDVGDCKISIDLKSLNGEAFDIDQIGGYENLFRIYKKSVQVIRDNHLK